MDKEQQSIIYDGYDLFRLFGKNIENIFNSVLKVVSEIIKVINEYPNRRVVHLALYGKKQRTQKKNLKRILKRVAEVNQWQF